MSGICVAKHAGFCPGVSRAVSLIEQALDDGRGPIYCLGELIHNRTFNESLQARGVQFITPEDIPSLPKDALVFIRAHGATKDVYQTLQDSGLAYIDATCPYVQKIHRIASEATDATFIIIGDKNHPEVQGIVSAAPGDTAVYSGIAELMEVFADKQPTDTPAVLAVQTTFNTDEWKKCQLFIKSLYTHLKICDTICSATENRQREVRELAAKNDLTVVVGSRHSSNTVKLYRIAKEVGGDALLIETSADLAAERNRVR
ncbi:MAG: 4-hydroxy-3-methylbut-2-enyl diphosphate reductase, partial [Clostridia bacterium]|nr:4-hydroxy-3-methylbut-2-enyl diphosphate reductase [Clostridia bacterium]